MSCFICLFILLLLLIYIFFQINRLEPSFADSIFRFRDSISVSRFNVLVLPDEQLPKAFEVIM